MTDDEVINLPPISKGIPTKLPHDHQSSPQRQQEGIFSSQRSRDLGRWHRTNLKKTIRQKASLEEEGAECQKPKSVFFKNHVLASTVSHQKQIQEKEEKEEDEEKKAERVIYQTDSSCTDEAPEEPGSLSVGPYRTGETEHRQTPHNRELKQSPPNTMTEDEIPSLTFKQKRFCIYLCGGFKDTTLERRALMESVYPRLYLYCKQRGHDFRMMDLRAGVKDPVSNHHDLAEMHLNILQLCQETHGPNFFVFIGQKHETLSLPNMITQTDFEAILNQVERSKRTLSRKYLETEEKSQSSFGPIDYRSFSREKEAHLSKESLNILRENPLFYSTISDLEDTRVHSWMDYDQDLTLLQMWYKLDKNTVPAVYRLLPVSTNHPDFLSRDGNRRMLGRKAWCTSSLKLWNILRRSGPDAIGEEATNLLDWEVEQGLGGEELPEEHCHCYKRIITDLMYNLRSEHASQFVDLHKGRTEVNQTLHQAQLRFISNIHLKLRHTNIHETNVSWGRGGLSAKHNRSHQFYVDRLCSHFQRTITASLSRHMQVFEPKGSFDTQRKEVSILRVEEEIQRHARYGDRLAQGFTFRQDFLVEVKHVLEASQASQRAVLLLGEPGSGKTTTMAKLAQVISVWIPGDVKVLCRFVGLTSDSRNSLSELSSELSWLLGKVTEEHPLTLLLDALDEVNEEHEADLSWLCQTLQPQVFVILSASTESRCPQILQSQLKINVLSVPALQPLEISSGLASRLGADLRQLTDDQQSLFLQSCLSCPTPLNFNLAYEQTKRWTSFTQRDSNTNLADPNQLLLNVLVGLEREFGPRLVRRLVLLISLSYYGVTEEELLVLLGRDDRVTHEMDVLHHQTLPVSDYCPVPYGFVVQLLYRLKAYVVEAESDGTWVLRWTHASFSFAILKRYAPTEDSVKAIHADFADYFNGNAPNSQVFQPLAWIRNEIGGCYVFNLRKLHCLPYHYMHSGQIIPLLTQCLFNYEFLLHKLWGLSINHVLEDLKAAVIPEKELLDVKVLEQVLHLSYSVLLNDPCQLASQLLGRLEQIISQDKPVTSGDPRRYSFLHDLLAQSKNSSLPVLVPSYTCLLPPGGLTHRLLSALANGAHHLVSCSSDGKLNLWRLDEQTRPVHTLPRVDGSMGDLAAHSITLALDDTVLVLQMGHCLQVREVHSGKVLYMEKDCLDVPLVTSACDGRLLVVFYDGRQMVKVFDLAASCSLLFSVNFSLEFEPIHKDQSIVISLHSSKDYILFAYRDGGEAAVFNARAGVVSSVLKAQHPAASILAVEISAEYLLLFFKYPHKDHSHLLHIELFSSLTFQYLRSILGCSQDYVSQIAVAGGGSHIVAFCPSPHSGTTEIITWNLETEDHKHIARFSGLLAHGVCSDLHFCVGFCIGDRFLRVWDLASKINDQTLTFNVHKSRVDGTARIVTMQRFPRYVVCLSTRPGTVKVWNVARVRLRGHPVQVEHGLFSNSDIALVRDLRLFILTDRGKTNSADGLASVFQTLLVYDLRKKSYIKKQTGLFIVPCPQEDYHLLKESVMPWNRRSETQTPIRNRQERELKRENDEQHQLEREKFNSIDQYILSGDERVVVCSYFAHHFNVFSLVSEEHIQTLEDRCSHLSLRTAALTHSGGFLVVSNYSEAEHTPYLTLWDTQQGRVRKRLKNEPGICCIAISDDACRVVFGVAGFNKLKLWDPFQRKHKTISGYRSLILNWSSQLFITQGHSRALLLSDSVSMWDLDNGVLLSVFTPDSKIQSISLHGENSSLLVGFSDMPTLISLKLLNSASEKDVRTKASYPHGEHLFGESSSSEDEDED
ncbi:hypothetical protein DNTS_030265 [Danionella cerebrum]|uniref:NACHT domain-containing protein n=1 Tax=Danionella cerebrum TaxID=2873325 RepID=A0A553NW84_9TELE|nr:hypothetical protein DNTS_030265 [Danionella translucida]